MMGLVGVKRPSSGGALHVDTSGTRPGGCRCPSRHLFLVIVEADSVEGGVDTGPGPLFWQSVQMPHVVFAASTRSLASRRRAARQG